MQAEHEPNEVENAYAPPSEFHEQEDSLEASPFQSIWTRPRVTVRQIISTNPSLHVILLACLGGVGQTLDRASTRNAGDQLSLGVILLLALVLGPIAGLFSVWIGSLLILLAGKMIGGKSNFQNITTAMAWASVPAVFALPLWIPQILMFGADMFTEATPTLDANPVLTVPFFGIAMAEIVLGVWAFVLLCNTIAEVQGFRSAWSGLGNILLAALILIVPLLAIVVLLVGLS
ncbi:MAG: Yip1 family protein [Aureliella sp.]